MGRGRGDATRAWLFSDQSLCLLSVGCGAVRHKVHFPFDAQALDGKLHAISENDKQLNRVFVFLSTTCPIANSYITELNRLQRALPPRVELFGVVSEQERQGRAHQCTSLK